MSNILSNDICNNTEQLIKDKAKELYFIHGNWDATTQQIADYAGTKRTLVNYYFRSKNNLFAIVFHEIIIEMKSGLDNIYALKIPFKDKIDQLIDYMVAFRLHYPFFEVFKFQQLDKIMKNEISIVDQQPLQNLNNFLNEIQNEMDKGTIEKSDPVNFILNINSLVTHPILLKPIYTNVYKVEHSRFDEILQERKELIKKIIFK